MQSDTTSAEAVYIRALCIYRDDWEQGLKCLENVIRLDPDHSKAKAMISKIRTFQKEEEIGSWKMTFDFKFIFIQNFINIICFNLF